jgi:hypothetical protein
MIAFSTGEGAASPVTSFQATTLPALSVRLMTDYLSRGPEEALAIRAAWQ